MGHTYNHWLFSRLLEEVFPLPGAWNICLRFIKACVDEEQPSGKEKLRDALRNLMLRLPCPRLKGMSIGQTPGSRLPCCTKATGQTNRARRQNTAVPPLCTLTFLLYARTLVTLFMASLPQLLANQKHPARLTPDPLGPRLRVASVLAYEDASYRQSLARWRGRGNRLMYAARQ